MAHPQIWWVRHRILATKIFSVAHLDWCATEFSHFCGAPGLVRHRILKKFKKCKKNYKKFQKNSEKSKYEIIWKILIIWFFSDFFIFWFFSIFLKLFIFFFAFFEFFQNSVAHQARCATEIFSVAQILTFLWRTKQGAPQKIFLWREFCGAPSKPGGAPQNCNLVRHW